MDLSFLSISPEVFEKEFIEEFNIIVEALEFLTEYYTKSRLPRVLQRKNLQLDELMMPDIANKGLLLAEKFLR
uniref:HEPN domain-containing protein n=1 Tax=Ignisphaera aggregans TaxID=334771 RepID=A0A7C5YTL1_9CREN